MDYVNVHITGNLTITRMGGIQSFDKVFTSVDVVTVNAPDVAVNMVQCYHHYFMKTKS